uniref:organic solute transporter subunit alpha-like n=1 Tax=Styela clava TaxID=7725 RepID=UPI00193A48A6|nr:organic solute transporter subunit alpha-like [Styela clava]
MGEHDTNGFFSGFNPLQNITSMSDLELQRFQEECRGPPPSAKEIVSSMGSTHLVVHLVLIVMAFTTLAIFIEEIFYLRSKIRKNYRRRRMSVLQAGIPPIFTLTAVVGTFFPRGNLMIDFVCSIYFGFAMHALLNLMVNYYGGITAMLKRLRDVRVKISTPPVCCCCRCLPEVPMTRKTFKYLYCLTFQAAASRPVVLFFRGVFVLDPTFSINELIFTVVLAISMLTGMWALIILRGVSSTVLSHFNITAKFFCFQAVLLISNIQPFVLKLASLPCVLPYTTRGRIITVNYQIIIVEFFLLSLVMRCLYRTKGDADNLEEVEKRKERKIQNSATKTTLVSDASAIEMEKLMPDSKTNGNGVHIVENV